MTNILSGHALIDSLEIGDDELAEISLILEIRRNISMSIYKIKYMKRRVAMRMRSCRCLDAASYCNLLRQSERELDLLKKALTIHVSQFFRNPSMFEKLQKTVLPQLFKDAGAEQHKFNFQSLGCAGGEEAYSLGIILREFFFRELQQTPTEIHALDIDADILRIAARAQYDDERLKNIPDAMRNHYFTTNGPLMQLSENVRCLVRFHLQNIMDVGLLETSQLVLCRNTLIYFTRPDQEKILLGIANILKSGGILVLGKSETLVGEVRSFFTTVCPVERIYRRR